MRFELRWYSKLTGEVIIVELDAADEALAHKLAREALHRTGCCYHRSEEFRLGVAHAEKL